MCEVLNKEEKKENKLKQLFKNPFSREEQPFTAESCFIQSRYGEGCYRNLNERIKEKQEHIRNVIRSKFAPSPNMMVARYSSYHAIIDIEEDLINYTDEIFKPFVDGGFEIINLTKECKSVIDEGIYMVSWKNAFKQK